MELDTTDRRLVAALTRNGRATVTALAREVGLSGPAVHERLRKLADAGVVRGYTALVDPVKVNAGTAAFVALHLVPGMHDNAELEAALVADPRVLEIHEIAGEDCYLIKVRVASPQELSATLHRFKQLGPTASTRTTMVLRTVLERPLTPAAPEPEPAPGQQPRPSPAAAGV